MSGRTILIPRAITPLLRNLHSQYPVVTVVGPRQSGKTTLTKLAFPEMDYHNLEAPDIRARAIDDPRAFLAQARQRPMILDEIQNVPELLSYIQVLVDQWGVPGRFVLTGSHQPRLHEALAQQSLAGRTALLTLLPLSVRELRSVKEAVDPFELIVQGLYPAVHARGLDPFTYYRGYVSTYVERDVRMVSNVRDLHAFRQFVLLLAGRSGQLMNHSSLADDVGVSMPTIKNWIAILEASYLVVVLHPYHRNVRKRVVRSPKVYFTDPGLVAYLLGIHDAHTAALHPLRGALYETLVIMEVMKEAHARGMPVRFHFYRDSHGHEVDLVLEHAGRIVAVEIKSSSTYSRSFLRGIRAFRKALGENVRGVVLYRGDERFTVDGIEVMNPFMVTDLWEALLGSEGDAM